MRPLATSYGICLKVSQCVIAERAQKKDVKEKKTQLLSRKFTASANSKESALLVSFLRVITLM
jgi:hypothetical protein